MRFTHYLLCLLAVDSSRHYLPELPKDIPSLALKDFISSLHISVLRLHLTHLYVKREDISSEERSHGMSPKARQVTLTLLVRRSSLALNIGGPVDCSAGKSLARLPRLHLM